MYGYHPNVRKRLPTVLSMQDLYMIYAPAQWSLPRIPAAFLFSRLREIIIDHSKGPQKSRRQVPPASVPATPLRRFRNVEHRGIEYMILISCRTEGVLGHTYTSDLFASNILDTCTLRIYT